jgi:hypothetical protein
MLNFPQLEPDSACMSLVRRGVTALIADGCGERRDNTPCAIDLNDGTEAFRNNQRQGLWAPAFAGATAWAWKHGFAISRLHSPELCQ